MDVPIETRLLFEDLIITFGFPLLFFVVGSVWFSFAGGLTRRRVQVVLATSLAFFAASTVLTIRSNLDVLTSLWLRAPVAFSFLYLFCTLAMAMGVGVLFYSQLRPSKWRKVNHVKSE
jgi:hypothetical protein